MSSLSTLPSQSDLACSGTLKELYGKLDKVGMGAGWNKPAPSLWPAPRKTLVPAHWKYELARAGEKPEPLKTAPARFDARNLSVTQHHAQAEDGTRIPYFQVGRADLPLDGNNAVLLTGYGGFEVSSLPYYAQVAGKLWLERGGVFVMANIRGGGEFGPAWHEAGRRAGKKVAQDDFAAVARDLIARRVTRPARLACEGGSNGGLLVGNMYARYPELFGAIICQVPLLDMRRYTKLTAGPSWVAEY